MRTKEFARGVIRMFVSQSKHAAAQILGQPAVRAGTSIGANYREAGRARSKAEFLSKVGDCRKEAGETEYWLELLADESFVKKSNMTGLLDEAGQLIAILVMMIRSSKAL